MGVRGMTHAEQRAKLVEVIKEAIRPWLDPLLMDGNIRPEAVDHLLHSAAGDVIVALHGHFIGGVE